MNPSLTGSSFSCAKVQIKSFDLCLVEERVRKDVCVMAASFPAKLSMIVKMRKFIRYDDRSSSFVNRIMQLVPRINDSRMPLSRTKSYMIDKFS
jgi:hypothetical protein